MGSRNQNETIEFENWEKERDRDRESVDFEGSLLELQISWPKHTYLTTKLLISYVFKLHNIYKFGSVGFSVKKSSITIEPKTKKKNWNFKNRNQRKPIEIQNFSQSIWFLAHPEVRVDSTSLSTLYLIICNNISQETLKPWFLILNMFKKEPSFHDELAKRRQEHQCNVREYIECPNFFYVTYVSMCVIFCNWALLTSAQWTILVTVLLS